MSWQKSRGYEEGRKGYFLLFSSNPKLSKGLFLSSFSYILQIETVLAYAKLNLELYLQFCTKALEIQGPQSKIRQKYWLFSQSKSLSGL